MRSSRAVLAAIAASAILLSACGDDEPSGNGPAGSELVDRPGGESGHIHGLVQRDEDLLIATHGGVWRARAGQTRARRVGDTRPDIMGLAAASPRRLVGSGHPQLDQDLPVLLGLVESLDGGRTWDPVSLLGKADFHALAASGQRIYGFDGVSTSLMVSRDGGQRWRTAKMPAEQVVSLAIGPDDRDVVLATTERGLVKSSDAGRRWEPVGEGTPLLVTWPVADRLFTVAPDGGFEVSADAGRSWQRRGTVGSEPVAISADASRVSVALADGRVMESRDAGRTWEQRTVLS